MKKRSSYKARQNQLYQETLPLLATITQLLRSYVGMLEGDNFYFLFFQPLDNDEIGMENTYVEP